MGGKRICGFLVVAALINIASARAAIIDVTYTGIVTSGYDTTGIFGAPSDNLANESYSIVYRFNTSIGSTVSSPTFNSDLGGSQYGYSTPSLGAIVTVNGVSAPFIVGNYIGRQIGQNDNTPVSQQFSQAEDFYYTVATNTETDNFSYSSVYNYYAGSQLPASITTSFDYKTTPADNSYMISGFASYDYSTQSYAMNTYVKGSVTEITLSVEDAPAPVAGAGPFAALALAGAAFSAPGRRRRRPT